jgi:aconitate hydratase 2/2-methylisocitrate dehydratase
MLSEYKQQVQQRANESLPPLPLDAEQTTQLLDLLKQPPAGEEALLIDLLVNRIPPGVDDAAKVKAEFLADIAQSKQSCILIDAAKATEILGTMGGGYNIQPLVDLLDIKAVAPIAVTALSDSLLIADAWYSMMEKAKNNQFAKQVVDSWAAGEWFTKRNKLPESLTVCVLKIPGETNTDDLSPATDAWSRPDIPLHAKAMLVTKMPDALEVITALKQKGHTVAYVGDVVGTGSSRKSAIN